MRLALTVAFLLFGCNVVPASQREGCHYVGCGDLLDGHDGPRCNIIVDGRVIANLATGQEAIDFMRRNGLRTCTPPAPVEDP